MRQPTRGELFWLSLLLAFCWLYCASATIVPSDDAFHTQKVVLIALPFLIGLTFWLSLKRR